MNKDSYFDRTFVSEQFNREKNYWLNKLSGNPEKSAFPGSSTTNNQKEKDELKTIPVSENQEVSIQKIENLFFKFPGPLSQRLLEVSDGSDSRLHMVLITGLFLLLNHYTGNRDITIATPIDKQEIEGEFINTVLPLRAYTAKGESFREFLMKIRQTIIEATEHQNYPIVTLPFDMGLTYSPGDNFPLFDVALLLENIQDRQYLNEVNINIIFSLLKTEIGIEGKIEFNTALYDEAKIAKISEKYCTALQSALANPGILLDALCLMSDTEKEQLLIQFNQTKVKYTGENTIHERFIHQVEKTPDYIALSESDDIRMISYRELNKKSESLAEILQKKSVKPGNIIPVMGQRKIEIINGILGILKAGGAYLPIDATSPQGRIQFLLKDSKTNILLTQNHLIEHNQEVLSILPHIDIILLDALNNDQDQLSTVSSDQVTSTDPAYVIYTSGTTGTPKGVMISHYSATNYLNWATQMYVDADTQSSNFALYTSISFDMTITSIFTPLITGNTLVLYGGDYSQLLVERILEEKRVDILKLTPSHLKLLREKEISNNWQSRIKKFIVGGEALDTPLANEIYLKFNSTIEIFNEYGPTEATVGCMIYQYTPGINQRTVPIGVPAANTHIFLLNKNLTSVPEGIAGDIYIGGSCLSIGYLNRPELTAERFIVKHQIGHLFADINSNQLPDKLNLKTNSYRMYKTGDLAQWIPGGLLEYIGRSDDQVKIRGYRIEPGEIEKRLTKHFGIKEALVIPRKDDKEDKYLCAYITKRSGYDETLKPQELREFVSQSLPEYMVPSFFVILDNFPLTSNGKIDIKSLPGPKPGIDIASVPPRNKTEKKLASIWADILGVEQKVIGIDDDYFSLGGHSLNATILAARINKEWEVKISLIQIFQYSTVRKLALSIQEAAQEAFEAIYPVELKEYYEVSSAQQRMFVLQQLDPNSGNYNIPIAIPIAENIDREKIQSIFTNLIARHESLRTSFILVNEKPVQKIHTNIEFKIRYIQVNSNEIEHTQFTKPFDLSCAPLIDVQLIKIVDQNSNILFIQMHHIVTDGISMEILKQEFIRLYQGETLLPLKLHYKDFSSWQAGQKRVVFFKQQEEYWLNTLAGELPSLDLPLDFARPPVQAFDGDSVENVLTEIQTSAIKKIAQEHDMTLYMVILSIFNILLSKLSGQEDIIVGTPIAGRRHADLNGIIGMFVNTLIMRNYPKTNVTTHQFFEMIKSNTLDAYENQECPFDYLVDLLEIQRDTSRNPIFNVMFDFVSRDFTGSLPSPKQKENSNTLKENKLVKFDLILTARDYGERISLEIEYCTKLFNNITIEKMVKYILRIISLLSTPSTARKKLVEIDIMDEDEKKRVLFDFNQTWGEPPTEILVHKIFHEVTELYPEHIALVGTPNEKGETHFSYQELNAKANQLTSLLRNKGARPDTPIGICIERSVEMIIGILAILKVGGAYLPIEPSYPQERREYILKDSHATLWITRNSEEKANNNTNCNTIFTINSVDSMSPPKTSTSPIIYDETSKENRQSPSTLAYIMYTSGSTGRPKGVMVSHKNVVHIVNWYKKAFDLNSETQVVSMANYTFDTSVEDIFGTILTGGTLFICPGDILLNKVFFRNCIQNNRINIVNFVPGVLGEFLGANEKLESLNTVICGGEALSEDIKNAILQKGYRLYNNYGPTEITVDALSEECHQNRTVSLGHPIANTSIYILNEFNRLVPVGVPGELCISGDGISQGYINHPQMTAEKFIRNLWSTKDSFRHRKQIVYKTGDKARWHNDGRVEFLGRQDFQIKVRGNRVELGEIEETLKEYDGVKDSIVVYNRELEAMIAYLVPKENNSIEIIQIRDYIKSRLPAYMEPTFIELIERIPLTIHGKLNRKALPEPEMQVKYTAPADEIERKLAKIWEKVLHIPLEKLSVEANFFELGGHSLRATIVIANIHREFNINIPLMKLFTHPTIRDLGEYLKNSEKAGYAFIRPLEEREYYALSSAQKRLYALQHRNPESTVYNMLSTFIVGDNTPIHKIESALNALIERHESLRTSFELVEDTPVQKIHKHVKFSLETIDLDKIPLDLPNQKTILTEEIQVKIEQSIRHFIKPFDLTQAPLLRSGLLNTNRGVSILIVDIHHIVSDGASQTVMTNDFMAYFTGQTLPAMRLQYKDFCQWRNQSPGIDEIKKQEQFWLNEFQGYTISSGIPTDFQRPGLQSYEGDIYTFQLEDAATLKLKEISHQEGVTLFMVLLAIYNILISKLSGQEDIVIGTGTANRRHADLENIIGIFVNTLALRNYPNGEKTFKEFLHELKSNTLRAFENQDYFYEDLVEKLFPKRDLSRNPLFDTVLMLDNLENYQEDSSEGKEEGKPLQQYGYNKKESPFDIILNCTEVSGSLKFTVGYCTKLYKEETIQSFFNEFKQITKSLIENPDIVLNNIVVSQDVQLIETEIPGYDFDF